MNNFIKNAYDRGVAQALADAGIVKYAKKKKKRKKPKKKKPPSTTDKVLSSAGGALSGTLSGAGKGLAIGAGAGLGIKGISKLVEAANDGYLPTSGRGKLKSDTWKRFLIEGAGLGVGIGAPIGAVRGAIDGWKQAEVRMEDVVANKGWAGREMPAAGDFRSRLFERPKYDLSDEDYDYAFDRWLGAGEGDLTDKDRDLASRYGVDPKGYSDFNDLYEQLELARERTAPLTPDDLKTMSDREVVYDWDVGHSPDLYPHTPEGSLALGRTYGEDSYLGPKYEYDPEAMAGMLRQLSGAQDTEEAQRIYDEAVKAHQSTGGTVMS